MKASCKLVAVLLSICVGAADAATFVYVSNADDGEIRSYTLQPDGTLSAGDRIKAAKVVMPLAVTPDKRYLIAGIRSKPYQAITYEIDRSTGALKQLKSSPLLDSYAYIALDHTGRYLVGASYGGNNVGVYPVGSDATVGPALQHIPTARNAHSVLMDQTNRYVFVPHLGSDQVFQFLLDAKSGRLTANTPPVLQLAPGNGARHIRMSPNNRFLYMSNELTAQVDTLALDANTGVLTHVASVSALPHDSKLQPGVVGAGVGGTPIARNRDNDIWASDLQLTPDGRFLYVAERRNSTLSTLGVDATTGKATYVGSVATEKQPRNLAIDPAGRYLVISGELSDTISSYAIDRENGALKLVGKSPSGKNANWVEIVDF